MISLLISLLISFNFIKLDEFDSTRQKFDSSKIRQIRIEYSTRFEYSIRHDQFINRKISRQRCDFFFVKWRVERFAYELNLSSIWCVYSVILMTQLKFVSIDENSYRRLRFSHFDVVEMKNDTSNFQFYEIKKIVDKRIRKYNRIYVIQYLIKWLKYESKYDKWKNFVALKNSIKLIKKNTS